MIVLNYENTSNLSLNALGILGTMVNNPECDYCTFECLCSFSPKDDKKIIKQSLNELIEKEYVLTIGNHYAVNKEKIFEMKNL